MPPDDSRRLSSPQQAALKQLLMGASITEAAQAAGVTVSEWCNRHSAFQAELSERRSSALRDAEQQRTQRSELLIRGSAVQVCEREPYKTQPRRLVFFMAIQVENRETRRSQQKPIIRTT